MLADLDRALDRLRVTGDTISANLLELERDPNYQLLEVASLTGESAQAWADARDAIAAIWDWYARFTGFLEQASALRVSPQTRLSPGRERDLADFLSSASIELRRDEVPLRERDLLQDRVSTTHCTADELLTLMSEAFTRARGVAVGIGSAWNELAPRVAAARGMLAEIDAAAGSIGDVDPELLALRRRLDALTETFVADPLSVTPEAVAAVEHDTANLRDAIQSALRLRDELAGELAKAQDLLVDLELAIASARIAHGNVTLKIAEPGIPDAPVLDPGLAPELQAVAILAASGDWRAAQHALVRWHATIAAMLRDVLVCAATIREPLEARDRLRGRLDAYRAKADGLGRGEDRELCDEYDRAHTVLYTAPTDLDTATALVQRYQRSVSGNDAIGKGKR
jgi:hypothetical protein